MYHYFERHTTMRVSIGCSYLMQTLLNSLQSSICLSDALCHRIADLKTKFKESLCRYNI